MKGIYGLILAGGASQRMGGDKAQVCLAGEPLIEHVRRNVTLLVEDVFISRAPTQAALAGWDEAHTFMDSADFRGPLAGLISAFTAMPDVFWLVVTCDMPFMDATHLSRLCGATTGYPVCFAKEGVLQPFPALWSPAAASALLVAVQRGERSPRRFLEQFPGTRPLKAIEGEAWRNMNSRAALAKAEALGLGSEATRLRLCDSRC